MQTNLRIDMRLTDDHILDLLKKHADSKGTTRITLQEIATAVRCSWRTAQRSAKRLEDAKKLKRHGGRGRGGITYEVLDLMCL